MMVNSDKGKLKSVSPQPTNNNDKGNQNDFLLGDEDTSSTCLRLG